MKLPNLQKIEEKDLKLAEHGCLELWKKSLVNFNKSNPIQKTSFFARCDDAQVYCQDEFTHARRNLEDRLDIQNDQGLDWGVESKVQTIARNLSRYVIYSWVSYWTYKKYDFLLNGKYNLDDYKEVDAAINYYAEKSIKVADIYSHVKTLVRVYNEHLQSCFPDFGKAHCIPPANFLKINSDDDFEEHRITQSDILTTLTHGVHPYTVETDQNTVSAWIGHMHQHVTNAYIDASASMVRVPIHSNMINIALDA